MAVRYLLPCEMCGSTTPVDMSQAGGSVMCGCGETLEVPSLRAIRELTPSSEATDARKYQWNPAAGVTFASGVVIALVGAGVALFMHLNSLELTNLEPPPEDEVAAWIAEVDSAAPEELIEMWNVARHVGLGDYHASPFVQARMVSQRLAMYRNIGLIVVASGLAFAGSSVFLRRRSA
ncbi:MAG: hypothetical protein QF918_00385 [Pirellulaceae bacterium]|nr:hypothetical protein [Pirellulaceae bacterium]MDP6557357.1 hypothetical protein [Pirellulaceae bacterium]